YLGCSAQPRLVQSTTITNRLNHTSRHIFIWTSFARKHCTMHDELAAQPRRDPHHATTRNTNSQLYNQATTARTHCRSCPVASLCPATRLVCPLRRGCPYAQPRRPLT